MAHYRHLSPQHSAQRSLMLLTASPFWTQRLSDPFESSIEVELVIRDITKALSVGGGNMFATVSIICQGYDCDISWGQVLNGFLEQRPGRNVSDGK